MKSLPWFRMWAEAVDDEKLRLLAFEDRWHFVALLCLKCQGTLDSPAPHLDKRIALKLGLQLPQLEEVKRRLLEVGLVDDAWQPIKWAVRQFEQEKKAKDAYIYFIGGSSGDVKIGHSKNPWARLVDLKSEHKRTDLEVLATVRLGSSSSSEVDIHADLERFRVHGEWFKRAPVIEAAMREIGQGHLKTEGELRSFIRSYYVVNDNVDSYEQIQIQIQSTDSEKEKNSVRASPSDPPPAIDDQKAAQSPTVDAAIFAEARQIFGSSIGGQLNRAIRAKGKPWVVDIIERCRGKDPEAARAYLAAAMQSREQKPGRFRTA
jgi:hypothetical protein